MMQEKGLFAKGPGAPRWIAVKAVLEGETELNVSGRANRIFPVITFI